MKATTWWRMLAAFLTLTLIAAACGSNSDDASAGETDSVDESSVDEGSADEPVDEGSADEPDGATAEASGETVLLATIMDEDEAIGQFFPEQRAAVAAAINYVNANGGLGGRGNPIDVEICVGLGTPEKNAECGRNIADGDALAMVGGAICRNDTAYPILQQATPPVPNVGSLSCLPSTHDDPSTFLTNNGVEGAAALSTTFACLQGATSMAMVLIEVPPILAQVSSFEAGNTCGLGISQVNMGPASGDGGPVAAQFLDVDFASTLLAPPQSGPVLAAASQQGYEGNIILAPTNMNRVILDATADANEGVFLARWTRPSASGVEGYDTYRAELEALGDQGGRPAVEWIDDEFGTNIWVSILAIHEALANCAECEISREGIVEAMSQLNNFDAGGITTPLDFTNPGQGIVSRTFTSQGFIAVIEGGQIKTFGDGESIDPS